MNSYGSTRHTARLALVRSAALEDADFGSAPNNPYAHATRWSHFGADHWDDVLDGKNRKEISNVVIGFTIVVATYVLLDALLLVYLTFIVDLALSGSFAELMLVSALFWLGCVATIVALYYKVMVPFLE